MLQELDGAKRSAEINAVAHRSDYSGEVRRVILYGSTIVMYVHYTAAPFITALEESHLHSIRYAISHHS
jgi:hypothetical protein